MAMGPVTPNPPVNTGGAPDVARPWPTDPPGNGADGWTKIAAVTDGGWDVIDDVDGNGDSGWDET